MSFSGDSVVKNPPANAGDAGSIPGSGRSSGVDSGNPLQYSCPGKFPRQRSLLEYSPWGHKESNTAAWRSTDTCILVSVYIHTHTCVYLHTHTRTHTHIYRSQPPNSFHPFFLPLVSICLISTSASLFLSFKQVHLYHFSRFHIYTLIYNICFSPIDLQLLWPSLQITEVDAAISLLPETSSGRLGDAQVSELARVEATSSWIPFLCSYSL